MKSPAPGAPTSWARSSSSCPPTPVPSPVGGPLPWHAVTVDLHPYEVCTLYLDLVEGRKQTRDLDSRRSVWATAHWVSKEE